MKFSKRGLPPIPSFRNAEEEQRWLEEVQRRFGALGNEAMTQISLRMPKVDFAWAKEIADATGGKQHDVLRRAIRIGLAELARGGKEK